MSIQQAQPSPVIKIDHLSHRYGKKAIYKDLNLIIEKGKIFGLLGKNGVGKSTLINLLMGYLKPEQGQCLVFGEHANHLSPATRARIALLYEGFINYDTLTIRQAEQFYAAFYPKWQPQHFDHLMTLMDVDFNQPLSSLSFGQKSQVILGLLIAQNADLLILDDYSMGLDAGYRRLFVDYLSDYLHGTDKTVLITTHVMSDLEHLIDEIAIVDRSTQVYQSSMKAFNHAFQCFSSPDAISLKSSPKIHRIEKYRQKHKIYAFHDQQTLETELGIPLTPEPMTFEDRFLGFVGKY
ncbi:ATP-binding cassette domain-containing protein [Thaumasiovibrio subtropicus]|uniref:ABC transporter ATP-binding protein n=1 Tax=Thaumasiovibrio subtropicus TaxID=1891207 RepID=UPI000B352FA0|nr:ABC transporter ATP-binding protein [Thaumasiovibrio subtropicus]